MSKKVVIFGNSGSGKSTLAKRLSETQKLVHFDLDTIAWLTKDPPERSDLSTATAAIEKFMKANPNGWVMEGAYGDLIGFAMQFADTMFYLDLPVDQCLEHADKRPWEPHKYPTKEAQDAQLEMLKDWIATYPTRKDELSADAHTRIFTQFDGAKTRITDRADIPEK